MTRKATTTISPSVVSTPIEVGGSFLLFSLAVVVALVWLDPALQLQANYQPFYLEWPFLNRFWGHPGGWLEYATAFLIQWSSVPAGAVVVHAVIAISLAAAAAVFLTRFSGQKRLYLGMSVAVPFLALAGRYADPALQTSLGVWWVIVVLAGYTFWPPQRLWGRLLIPWALTGVTYYFTGGFVLILGLLGAIFELRAASRHWTAAFSWLTSAAALPWLIGRICGIDGHRATYLLALHFYPWWLSLVTYGGIVLAAFLLLPKSSGLAHSSQPSSTQRNFWAELDAHLTRMFQSAWLSQASVLGLVAAVGVMCCDPATRALLRVDKFARQRDWQAVLAQASRLHAPSIHAREIPASLQGAYVDIERALYHRGLLSEELFSLWRPSGLPLFPAGGQMRDWCVPLSELFLELGQVNYAEHWAHEALELKGERPEILRTLGIVNQLKGRPAAARIFLSRLAKSPIQGAWARRKLVEMNNDPSGEHDPELPQLRAIMVNSDHPASYLDTQTLLRQALSANPHNRMAYEFLMADHLLNYRLEDAIRLLGQRDAVGLTNLPRHYQEAALWLHQARVTNSGAFPEQSLSQVTCDRFQIVLKEASPLRKDRSLLGAALAPEQADTLWYYYLVGATPGRMDRLAHLSSHEIKPMSLAAPPAAQLLAELKPTASPRVRIDPDYDGLVIPPNIAPLNFLIREPRAPCRVRIYGQVGEPLELESHDQRVEIPTQPWHALLEANRGGRLLLEFQARDAQRHWGTLDILTNEVARDGIDGWLVYRLIGPLYNKYVNVGIYQRNLSTFDESAVLDNRSFDQGCVNCHTFRNQRPETIALHIRSPAKGLPMLLGGPDGITRVEKTAGYMSWHPSGRWLAFSANKLSLFFHTEGENRDVYDANSDLGIYDVKANALLSPAPLAQPNRMETWPAWSPDGRFLYFCSAPKRSFNHFRDIHYDLNRVGFDPEKGTWGPVETLIDAQTIGKSIGQPRPSPDGRRLVFCLFDYGHFPIYQTNSDLCVIDLTTDAQAYRDTGINSPQADTWHSWSSNSRWMVFSSKRRDGLFARPHFTYVDSSGHFSKPFVLPQKDPTFYDACLKTFNVPELVTGPVPYPQREFAAAINSPKRVIHPNAVDARQTDTSDGVSPASSKRE
jgi:hypothetical protein